jgi:Secretion system C-terminal sorting domain
LIETGIHVTNCTKVSVTRNIFKLILPFNYSIVNFIYTSNPSYLKEGAAIMAEGNNTHSLIVQNPVSPSSGAGNSFAGCAKGIAIKGVNATVVSNIFTNTYFFYTLSQMACQIPIYSYLGQNAVQKINSNTIEHSAAGIYVYQCAPFQSFEAVGNTLSAWTSNNYAISFEELLPYNINTVSVLNNSITLRGRSIGIRLVSASNVAAKDNTINIGNYSMATTVGIQGSNSPRTTLSCNTISATNTYQGHKGIDLSVCPTSDLLCNTIENLDPAISFSADCNATNIEGNKIKGVGGVGILYTGGTTITGTQYNKGNEWLGSYSNGIQCNPFNINNNGWKTQNIAPYKPNYVSPPILNTAVSPAVLPILAHCTNANCASTSGGCTTCSLVNSVETAIADNSLEITEFEEAQKWSYQRNLFEKLEANPSIVQNNPLFQDFRDSLLLYSSVPDFKNVNDLSKNIYTYNNSNAIEGVKAQINTLLETQEALQILIENPTLSQNNLRLYKNQIIDNIASLELLQVQGIISTNVIEQENKAIAMENANTNLSEINIYEDNEKSVNAIYLATIARNITGFTSTQMAILSQIAGQCPLAGGTKAVFDARSLLGPYQQTTYNDSLLCQQVNMSWRVAPIKSKTKTTTIADDTRIYPNPNFGLLNIISKSATRVQITDVLGKVLITENNSNQSILNINTLSEGVYLVSLYDNEKLLGTQKIVLLKTQP